MSAANGTNARPPREDYFGEGVAERYDESVADMFEPGVVDPAVDLLAHLAGDGAALELGIGTGRIALPLTRRGVRVHGIDLSAAIVARLRSKPGAENIDVAIGDFATTRVDGRFTLAYLVFNTINNLTTHCLSARRFAHSRLARRTSASTSSTLQARVLYRTTFARWTEGSRSARSRSATCGRRSST